jgi:hypothetical protein
VGFFVNKMKQPQKQTVAIETITPKMAAEWLQKSHSNQRNLTNSHMWHLAQQMESGQWKMNGESIIIDWDGNIADGQHRLHSVIKSGAACDFVVVRGIDPSCFPTIDRGKPRSNGNVFAINGIANYNTAAAAVGGVLNYRRAMLVPIKKEGEIIGHGGSLNSYIRPSTTDMLEEYEKHPAKYEHAIKIALACRKKAPPSCVATVAALALIDGKMGEEWVDEFWKSFESGANLAPKSPILKLRDRLEKHTSSSLKLSAVQITMLMVKAWNLYATEKECGVLRVESDGVVAVI